MDDELVDLIKSGAFTSALSLADQLLTKEHTNQDMLLVTKCDIFRRMGDFDSSIELAEQIINNSKSNYYAIDAIIHLIQTLNEIPDLDKIENQKITALSILGDDPNLVQLKPKLYISWAKTCCLLGENATAIENLDRAKNLMISDTSTINHIHLLINYAYVNIKLAKFDTALEYLEEALVVTENLGYQQELSYIFNYLGTISFRRGKSSEALYYYLKSLEIRKTIENLRDVGNSIHNVGNIYWLTGDFDTALDYYQQSLGIKQEYGNLSDIAHAMNNIGLIHEYKGELEEALQYYKKSMAFFEKSGTLEDIARAQNNIALIFKLQGDFELALNYLQQSYRIRKQLGNPTEIARSLINIGQIYVSKGEMEEGVNYFRTALKSQQKIGNKGEIAHTLHNLGKLAFLQNKLQEANDQYLESLEYFNNSESELGLEGLYFDLIQLSLKTKDKENIDTYHEFLRKHAEGQNNLKVQQLYKVATALIQKEHPRLLEKLKAQEMFKEVIFEDVTDQGLTVLAMVNYCELTLLEFESLKDPSLVNEIQRIADEIYKIAQIQKSYPLIIYSLVLLSKLDLIDFEFKEAYDLLEQALLFSVEKNLPALKVMVEKEIEQFNENINYWHSLAKASTTLRDRVNTLNLSSYLEDLKKSARVSN